MTLVTLYPLASPSHLFQVHSDLLFQDAPCHGLVTNILFCDQRTGISSDWFRKLNYLFPLFEEEGNESKTLWIIKNWGFGAAFPAFFTHQSMTLVKALPAASSWHWAWWRVLGGAWWKHIILFPQGLLFLLFLGWNPEFESLLDSSVTSPRGLFSRYTTYDVDQPHKQSPYALIGCLII